MMTMILFLLFFSLSFTFPLFSFLFFPLSLPLEVGLLKSDWGLGERCELNQRGLGRSPNRNRISRITALKYHEIYVVATTVIFLLRISWPTF